MNKVFKEDPSCQNRDIALKTFKVIPVTNRLGTLEWVENTEMLKSIINREYGRLNTGGKLGESKSLSSVRETIKKEWLKKIPGNEDVHDIVGQHLKLLEVQSNLVINAFKK
jgi:phosphatidylinositol kinase/protein kinase (PI-3  family)